MVSDGFHALLHICICAKTEGRVACAVLSVSATESSIAQTGLHTVQVVRGALRIGDGGEDQPLVVFQRIHEGDIGGMVRADIRGDLQIGA